AITPPAKANDPFHSAAISPDGQVLASGQASGVKLWDAVTGKELRTLDATATYYTAFSPDGTMLATSHPGTIKLWEIPSGKERAALPDGENVPRSVRSITFAPDGKMLAA